jgi:hypothetical protein
MARPRTTPWVPSPEYKFEHQYDAYKFALGSVWWLVTALLCIGMIVEIATSTPTEQTLDETTIPSAIYALLLGCVFIAQPAYVFFQLLTIGVDTPQYERTIAQITLFSWLSNLVLGFIHFGVAERGAFAFVFVAVFINAFSWLGCIYFQYDAYTRRKRQ